MAMKFWFGKKMPEEGPHDTTACDVLAIAGETKSEMPVPPVPTAVVTDSSHSVEGLGSKVVMPLEAKKEPPAVVRETSVPAAVSSAPDALKGASGAGSEPPPPAASAMDAGKVSGAEGAGPSKGSEAEAPKPVLKTIGVASRVVPLRPVASQAPAGSGGTGTGRLTFGLKPKSESAEAKPAAPAEAPAAATSSLSPAAAAAPATSGTATGTISLDGARPKGDQRALYYQLMNGLYDAVMILDDKGHVVDCNSRFTEVLGYSREESWDMPVDKIITGMSNQMFGHLRRSIAENHHVLIDARCHRKDGTSFAGEVGVSTLSLTRGDNIVFAIRNVERRKNAMDELRKSQVALEVALVPTFVCDTDGLFIVVNRAFLEAFGIPDEAQAKSVRFTDLLPDAARFFLRAACGEKIHEKLQIGVEGSRPIQVELSLSPVQSGQNTNSVAGSILQMT